MLSYIVSESSLQYFKTEKVRIYPLFRVMEIQRICEVTATPFLQSHSACKDAAEGANLSEEPVIRLIEQ